MNIDFSTIHWQYGNKTSIDNFNNTTRKYIDDRLASNLPIYVEILHGARKGSIARIKKVAYVDTSKTTSIFGSKYFGISSVVLGWDDRKNTTSTISLYQLKHLEHHTTGTVWSYKTKEKPKITAKAVDRFGVEFEIGNLVVMATGTKLHFGKVHELVPSGKSVKIETFTTKKREKSKITNIRETTNIVIIDSDLNSRILMSKLKS
jgi:hypothetical protein